MIKASSSTQKHFHTWKVLRREINTQVAGTSFPRIRHCISGYSRRPKNFKRKKHLIDIKNGSAIQRDMNQIEIILPTTTAFKDLLLFLQTSAS